MQADVLQSAAVGSSHYWNLGRCQEGYNVDSFSFAGKQQTLNSAMCHEATQNQSMVPNDKQLSSEGAPDRSFEDLVNKILATEDESPSSDCVDTELTLTEELLHNLAVENGANLCEQAPMPDLSAMSSTQIIQEALAWMHKNRNMQENSSLYSGMGSPHSSIAGSYSSGDEIGWPNVAMSRSDPEMVNVPPNISQSPQVRYPSSDFPMGNISVRDIQPPPQRFDSNPEFGNMPSPQEGNVFRSSSNTHSSRVLPNCTGMNPNCKNQNQLQIPALKGFKTNMNISGCHTPPLSQAPRSIDACATGGYPPKVSQAANFAPVMPGQSYGTVPDPILSNYQKVLPWQTQPRQVFTNNYQRPQAHSQMVSGYQRQDFNDHFQFNGKQNCVPRWLKRNQPLNIGYQQKAIFAENYSSLPNSPVGLSPSTEMGEISSGIENCQYQLQNLEKERRKTEAELVRMNPGKRISSSNTIAVPSLPPNPSPVDQLIVEEYREHSRMTTLLSKIGGLNSRALHPNIETCLDKWMSAIQAVEAHRTAELCHNPKGKSMLNQGNGSIVEKVRILTLTTSDARTKLWCALQLSKEKHIPPLRKELLNFIPDGVRLV
ncbi:uncharacterized protein [Diadema setosum]|uniref:uncharacterized protein n=1 Tax=Diadema setosum TaxID=31175 RepID=UPI003B3BA784